MTKIIGKRPGAPAACDLFIGSELPKPDDWRLYVVKSLPAGLILDYRGQLWETLGEGRSRMLTVDTVGEFVGDVAI